MRTFIAVDIALSSEIQKSLLYITQNLRGLDIKYVDLKHFHITLAFLGETSEQQVKDINNELKFLKNNLINLTLRGLGVFKSIHNPNVLWIGIKPEESLETLWNKVNKIVSTQGFATDQRGFSPHITLGRIKKTSSNHNLDQFIRDYRDYTFGELIIPEFILYQSILTPKGPIYKSINKFALKI